MCVFTWLSYNLLFLLFKRRLGAFVRLLRINIHPVQFSFNFQTDDLALSPRTLCFGAEFIVESVAANFPVPEAARKTRKYPPPVFSSPALKVLFMKSCCWSVPNAPIVILTQQLFDSSTRSKGLDRCLFRTGLLTCPPVLLIASTSV